MRELDIYWLSSGRSGTHWLHHVISSADNVSAHHDLGFLHSSLEHAVSLYHDSPDEYWAMKLEDDRWAKTKILENGRYESQVFTELVHAIYPFGYAIWDYYKRELPHRRLKLIHLVRNPIDCCSSMLRVERDEGGLGFSQRASANVIGASSAEKAANVWLRVNEQCAAIVNRLPANSTATVRIEDLSNSRALGELFDFCELRGVSEAALESLVTSRSSSARHSHVTRADLATAIATPAEMAIIKDLTGMAATSYGYR